MEDDAGRFRKGIGLLKQGKLEEAIEELEVAATTGEDLPIEHFALAVAYVKNRDFEAARAEFNRFLAMSPDDEKKIAYARAQLAKLPSPPPPTRKTPQPPTPPSPPAAPSRPAVRDASDPGQALAAAQHALEAGRDDEAIALFLEALAQDGGSAVTWNGLGKATYRNGVREAMNAFRRALESSPDDVAALFNLGMMARLSGDLELATDCFRRVTSIDPTDDEARRQLDSLA